MPVRERVRIRSVDLIVYLRAPDLQGRQSFVLEDEGPPDLVMEILLADTWMQDIGAKRDLYAAMGIREYWLYDPQSRCPRGEPRVQGFRLRGPGMRKSRRRCRARQTGSGIQSGCGAARCCRPRGGWMCGANCAAVGGHATEGRGCLRSWRAAGAHQALAPRRSRRGLKIAQPSQQALMSLPPLARLGHDVRAC